jgi:putative isomerase
LTGSKLFCCKRLENYGYIKEANSLARKIIHNAKGVLKDGEAIRENYQLLSGGLQHIISCCN